MRECADIMLPEVAKHFENPTSIEKVYFVLFDEEALSVFERAFKNLQDKGMAAW